MVLPAVMIGVFVVSLVGAFAYMEHGVRDVDSATVFATSATTSAKEFFTKKFTEFPDGTIIAHLEPTQLTPIQTAEQHTTVPAEHTVDDIIESSTTDESPLEASFTTPIILQYIKEQKVPIAGYIKIPDPASGQYIKPYIYKAMIIIQCASDNDPTPFASLDCNMTPIGRWVETVDGGQDDHGNDLGGYYYYGWRPHNEVETGLYEICIETSSMKKNTFGIIPTNSHCYTIELI